MEGLSPFKLEVNAAKKHHAAETSDQNGPTFGTGDLLINLNKHDTQKESQSKLGSSYSLPTHSSGSKEWQQTLLAGSQFFTLDDVEVFYLYSKLKRSYLVRNEFRLE